MLKTATEADLPISKHFDHYDFTIPVLQSVTMIDYDTHLLQNITWSYVVISYAFGSHTSNISVVSVDYAP